MEQDALQALLREAVGETVAEILQTLLHLELVWLCRNRLRKGLEFGGRLLGR